MPQKKQTPPPAPADGGATRLPLPFHMLAGGKPALMGMDTERRAAIRAQLRVLPGGAAPSGCTDEAGAAPGVREGDAPARRARHRELSPTIDEAARLALPNL